MKQITVTTPYEPDGPDCQLEPSSQGIDMGDAWDKLMWLSETSREDMWEGEIERVITSAAGLYALRAGTIAECLDTAIVWERG